jgi:hypothetical protein
MRRNTIVLTAAISIASTIPAFAHHGWGGNVDEVTAMTGTVTEGVKLAGPHGTMKIQPLPCWPTRSSRKAPRQSRPV